MRRASGMSMAPNRTASARASGVQASATTAAAIASRSE